MARMLLTAFHDKDQANMAIDELEKLGYTAHDLSIITRENRGEAADALHHPATEGAASGAATGTVVGGLAGLLAGAGVIPALAGLLIGGPIALALGATGIAATTISGAVTGALAGGLIGALTGLGLSEDEARRYDETLTKGGLVLGVPIRDEHAAEARKILEANGADGINEVTVPNADTTD